MGHFLGATTGGTEGGNFTILLILTLTTGKLCFADLCT